MYVMQVSSTQQEAAKGAELLLLGTLLQHYAEEHPDVVDTASLEASYLSPMILRDF